MYVYIYIHGNVIMCIVHIHIYVYDMYKSNEQNLDILHTIYII